MRGASLRKGRGTAVGRAPRGPAGSTRGFEWKMMVEMETHGHGRGGKAGACGLQPASGLSKVGGSRGGQGWGGSVKGRPRAQRWRVGLGAIQAAM